MSRAMKYSGIEWIGEMPKDWKTIILKRIFSNRSSGAWGEEAKNDENDRICIRIADFDYSKLSLKDNQEFTIRNYPTNVINRLTLKENDILIEKSGGGELTPVGRTILFKLPIKALYANFMDRLRCYEMYNTEFIQYVLVALYQNNITRKYIKQTTGIQNLDLTSLLSIEKIAIPPQKEQQKIAAFLDEKTSEIDNIIEKTTLSIGEYKKYKQSIITEAVTKGLKTDVKMKDSRVEHIGLIPIDWQVIKLKYLLEERNIKSITGTEEPLSMSQKYGLIKTKDMDMIPNMASSFIGNKHVEIGDLVFNKLKAHLGVFAVSEYNGLVSPDYAVYYKKNKNLNVKFLEYLFKTDSYINEFKKYSKGVGAGLTRLYTSDLFNIRCSLPIIDEQNLIVEFINNKCKKIDTLIMQKEILLTELEIYKKSLIFECVTGKREV